MGKPPSRIFCKLLNINKRFFGPQIGLKISEGRAPPLDPPGDCLCLRTTINNKGLHRTANEYAEERGIYKGLISKNKNVDILNSASRILQLADRTRCKLTLQDINTTPKELKTERDCSHRQLFRPLWGSSVWRNNQALMKKYPRTLILALTENS